MPLTGAQITMLAQAIDAEWDLNTLTLFASDKLDVQLGNLAPDGDLKERAAKLINALNASIPPRDTEFLEGLRRAGNATLRTLAGELLVPAFLSPTNDPHDAIVLGRQVFVNREKLRKKLRDFTSPNPYTTRVLVIRGEGPCGKSYSWPFLRHLARVTTGAQAQQLRLAPGGYTPRGFVEQVFALLRLDKRELPPMTDDPQLARIDPLINVFKGLIPSLPRPVWLVVDDINAPAVTPPVREAAYAIAYAVEEVKPDHLWVALLGYNAPITDDELRFAATDDAQFPTAKDLAEHFCHVARAGQAPLDDGQAMSYATVLLSGYPQLTKEAMTSLTKEIERMGEKLLRGERP